MDNQPNPNLQDQQVSEQAKKIATRRADSQTKYPFVPLDGDEYVVLSVPRSLVGLTAIFLFSFIASVLTISAWIVVGFMPESFGLSQSAVGSASLIFVAVLALVFIFSYINYNIYRSNRFVVTNERVIQWMVDSLMHRKKQTIKLDVIEDISYTQKGLWQHMFHYGTIRLSTVGDESTYTFSHVPYPNRYTEFIAETIESARQNKFITDEEVALGQKLSR